MANRVGENAIQKLQRLQKRFNEEIGEENYVDVTLERTGCATIIVDNPVTEEKKDILVTANVETVIKFFEASWLTRIFILLGDKHV